MVRITQAELEKEKPFLCTKCGTRYAEEKHLVAHQKLRDCAQRRENRERARARLAVKKIEVEKMLALQPEGRLVFCPSCEKLFAEVPYLMRHINEERCLGKEHNGNEDGELEEGEIKREEVKDDEGTETKIKREVIEKDETKSAAMIKSENEKVEGSPQGKGKGKERAELKVKTEVEKAVKVKVEEGIEHRSKDGKAPETPKLKMDSSFKVYKDGHLGVKVKVKVKNEKGLTEASPNAFPASPKHRKPKDKDGGRASK